MGEVLGLLGGNGAGKSTLLKIIFGSLTAKNSHLKVDGKFIAQGRLLPQIAYLPQGDFIPQHLKVKVLVRLYTQLYREELLKVPIISLNLEERFENLSGGNKRLLACLLVIYSDAKYILLDEPFSQVAPLIVEELKTHIQQFKLLKGFVVSDHLYEHIIDSSSRMVLIHQGSNYTMVNEENLRLYGYLPALRYVGVEDENR
ncbi:Lipopolysaccharide export system ATP-binding protein LptB [compost metagenome]